MTSSQQRFLCDGRQRQPSSSTSTSCIDVDVDDDGCRSHPFNSATRLTYICCYYCGSDALLQTTKLSHQQIVIEMLSDRTALRLIVLLCALGVYRNSLIGTINNCCIHTQTHTYIHGHRDIQTKGPRFYFIVVPYEIF